MTEMRSSHMSSTMPVHSARVALGSTLAFVAAIAFADAADAELGNPVRLGDVVVVDAADPADEIVYGTSSTVFTLRLPTGATCPGDSANDGWRYQTFMVPTGDDPGALSYNDIGPTGTNQWALYATTTNPVTDALLEMNDGEGKPGFIGSIPPLSFRIVPPGTIPAGTYTIGVSCTHLERQTAQYWDTDIVITEDPDDEPGQLTFRLATAPRATKPDDGFDSSRFLVVGAAVAAGGGVAAIVRQRRRTTRRARRTQEST